MFRPWKSAKRKMKATFIFQFQVTEVPKLKKPSLIIQLVPEDIGKPTFKLERAQVLNGKCTWDNPVYVTVKFSIDPKSDKLHEKLYHFIISNGSSKSGYLGESSVDLADFAHEVNPVTVSLPLKFANSGVVLHLNIRRVLEDGEGGYVEVQNTEEEWSGSEGSLQNSVGNGEKEEEGKSERPDVRELTRHAELADLEIQALKKQVVKEGKRVQELTHQIEEMKKEREESCDRGGEREGDGEAFEMLMSENRELKGTLRGLKRELFYEKEKTRELTVTAKGSEAVSKDEESELYILRKKIKDMSDEVAAYKEEYEKLEERVKGLTEDKEDLKAENREAQRGIKELGEEMAKRKEELAETVDYYEEKTRELEEAKESLNSELRSIRESKEKQEDRIMEAEDSLRKMKWKNSASMERLREEVRKKEELMESALMEAEELRARNEELEERMRRREERGAEERLQREVDRLRSELANRRDDELKEVETLKERNRSMEKDLKEMEDRYSEISLKFAEVEIERQQLVKTVRTLKGRTS